MILIHLKIKTDNSSELQQIALIAQDHTGSILGRFKARVSDYQDLHFLAGIICDLCEHVDCYVCSDPQLETVRSFVAAQSKIMPGSSDDLVEVDCWDLKLSDEQKEPMEAARASVDFFLKAGLSTKIREEQNNYFC